MVGKGWRREREGEREREREDRQRERERERERETSYYFVATMAMFLGDMEGSKVAISLAEASPFSLSRVSLSTKSSVSRTP